MFVHKGLFSHSLVRKHLHYQGSPEQGPPAPVLEGTQMPLTLDLPAPLAARQTRLSDLAFQLLAQAIVDDRLSPGQALRDHCLAEELGVSRTPVREALQRLERAGLVETMASRHTRVAQITPQRIADAMEFAGYAYGAATRAAVVRMNDASHDAAMAILDRLLGATGVAGLVECSREFFVFVNAQAANDVFALRADLSFLVDRAINDLSAAIVTQRIETERGLLRGAVATRDADAAELAVRRMHGVA